MLSFLDCLWSSRTDLSDCAERFSRCASFIYDLFDGNKIISMKKTKTKKNDEEIFVWRLHYAGWAVSSSFPGDYRRIFLSLEKKTNKTVSLWIDTKWKKSLCGLIRSVRRRKKNTKSSKTHSKCIGSTKNRTDKTTTSLFISGTFLWCREKKRESARKSITNDHFDHKQCQTWIFVDISHIINSLSLIS